MRTRVIDSGQEHGLHLEPESDSDVEILEKLIRSGSVLGFGRHGETMAPLHVHVPLTHNKEMVDIVCAENSELAEMLELAWGIIANAHGGDWLTASPEWKEAAGRWRDRFIPMFTWAEEGKCNDDSTDRN